MSAMLYDDAVFATGTLTAGERQVIRAKLDTVGKDMQWLRKRIRDMEVDAQLTAEKPWLDPNVSEFYLKQREVYQVMLEGYEHWHKLTMVRLAEQSDHRPMFRPAH